MRLYQDAVRVEYRQGTYSVTVVTSVPWDTEWVLRTLPCQVAARLSRRFSRSNLRILWRNDRLYSQIPRPFWRDLAGSGGNRRHRFVQLRCRPIGSFFTNSRAVSLRDWNRLQFRRKKAFSICVFIKTQYSFRISNVFYRSKGSKVSFVQQKDKPVSSRLISKSSNIFLYKSSFCTSNLWPVFCFALSSAFITSHQSSKMSNNVYRVHM